MNEANDIVSEKEAGRFIGLVGHTLRKWRQLRIGPPYIKISARCVRYRRADLLRWLESRRVEPGGDGERHTCKRPGDGADGGRDAQ
jgi:predicted DNA-binding transcriptional regulator AlpA